MEPYQRGDCRSSMHDQRQSDNPITPPSPAEQSAEVAKRWYIAEPLPVQRGWLVYTLDFVLATLQGCVAEPHKVKRTGGWLFLGVIVRAVMGAFQALIMLLANIPIVSSWVETVARVYSRDPFGFFLRACYWKAKLGYLGQDTIIDQNVEIWGGRSVSIGSRCHIDTSVRLAAGEQRHGQHGYIRVGNYVHLGPGVHIAGRGGVTIRNFVGVMANAHLYSATGVIEDPSDPGKLISMSHMAPPELQQVVEGPIVVEDYALLGMATLIMPRVRVGRGAIVHAHAEVTRDVPAFANFGGIPRGKRIGWRMPRRQSPQWSPREPVVYHGDKNGPLIREVLDAGDHDTIESVMSLHFGAFTEGMTTQLGRSFVHDYYIAMVTSPACSLWVAEKDGQVVGFLGCTTDRHHFEQSNRSGRIRLLALWRLLTFRLSPVAVLRAVRKQKLSRAFGDDAELLSIVVAPKGRRLGLGKRFLDIWLEKLGQSGQSSYIVFTDNPEGISFYEKYGGEELFKFSMSGLWSACYRFRINKDALKKAESQS